MDTKSTALASNPGFLEHFKDNDEFYHYLFPIALGGKYRLSRTSMMSFQLDLWGPNIIPSQSSFDPGLYGFQDLVDDRRKMAAMADLLLRETGSDFRQIKDKAEKDDADIAALAHSMANVLFGSVEKSHTNPFTFKNRILERMTPEAICQKFAYTMARRDIDDCMTEEALLADITQYVAPGKSKHYPKGSYFFWTEHLLNAFYDCGVVKVDASFQHMTLLQFINNY